MPPVNFEIVTAGFFCRFSSFLPTKSDYSSLTQHLQQPVIIKKINRSKTKISEKWCCSDDNAQACAIWSGVSWTTLHKGFTCALLSQENQDNIDWLFSFAMLSGASRTTLHRNFPAQCCPRSIKTTLHRIFFHAILPGAFLAKLHKLLPVQSCPKSGIKTALNSIFSCSLLSGASRITFHRLLTCAMLSQEY